MDSQLLPRNSERRPATSCSLSLTLSTGMLFCCFGSGFLVLFLVSPLSVSPCLCLFFFLPLSLSLFLSRSPTLSLSLSLSLSISLYLSLYLSLSLSRMSISLSLSLSLSLSRMSVALLCTERGMNQHFGISRFHVLMNTMWSDSQVVQRYRTRGAPVPFPEGPNPLSHSLCLF